MPANRNPHGPPSRQEALADRNRRGVRQWGAIRSAQAKAQEQPRQGRRRRSAGEIGGPGPRYRGR